jgi:serine protease Do
MPVRSIIAPLKQKARFASFCVLLLAALAAASTAQPGKVPTSFAEIAKKVEPAVVSIDTKSKIASQPVAKGTPAPGDSDDIMEFFRRQLPQRPVYAVGSGFIVDKSGYIITNGHVIDDAARITVKLDSGEELAARVVGTDDETDLAVLKVEAGHELPFVKLGDSEKAQVGDWVLAIGSPFGLAKTVTAGIISQTQRSTPYASAFQKFIQTDAAINRGNSGGPLVNMDGEVIGVNSQIATSTGDYNGVGFALPAGEVINVYDQIINNGKVRRGYLGVYLDTVQPEFAKVYGLKDAQGTIVTNIIDKLGPASVAGIQAGDIITEFNGQKISTAQQLIAWVAATRPSQIVTVNLLRENGKELTAKTVSITLGERPSNSIASEEDPGRKKLPLDKADEKPFGLTLAELTPTLAATYKLEGLKGLVVREINPASFIADVKNSLGGEALGEGDLIQRINRVPVTDLKAFTETVSKLKPGDAVVLHVMTYSPQAHMPQLKIVQFTVK